jgi:hypothetical protein
MLEWEKWSAYGVPVGLPSGDTDSDGDWDATDPAAIIGGYDVRKGAELDGDVDATHANTVVSGYQTLGRNVMTSTGIKSRKGYAGYDHDPSLIGASAKPGTFWHVRDPAGYIDGMGMAILSRIRLARQGMHYSRALMCIGLIVIVVTGCSQRAHTLGGQSRRGDIDMPRDSPPVIRNNDVSAIPIETDTARIVIPDQWQAPDAAVEFTPIREDEAAAISDAARRALACYPTELLSASLERVYLVGSIRYAGHRSVGLYHNKCIYISTTTLQGTWNPRYMAGTMHHELSSVLLQHFRDRFPLDAWMAANPAGFSYINKPTSEIDLSTIKNIFVPELAKIGFLSPYAQTNIENDFNIVACALFHNDDGLWQYVAISPALATKIRLAISFYSSIHPSFTEDFFRTKVKGGYLR